MNFVDFISPIIAFLGISIIVVVGAILWAKKTITNVLGGDFVTQNQHLEKEKAIREEISKKYEEIQKQLEKNHKEWEKEITHLKDEYDKNKEVLIEINTKVTLLLNNKIKRD